MTHKQVLRIKDVMARTAFSKSHVYRLVNAGKFPAPIKISERIIAWDESEVDNWLADKFATATRSTQYSATQGELT
jgi:prophage regulatory protein